MHKALVVVFALSLAGCSSVQRVGEVKAHPSLKLPKSSQTIALRLGPAVKDTYTSGQLEVSTWKDSLTTAFATGFADVFTISFGQSDLLLEVQEAELKPGPQHPTIDYQAQLFDGTGKPVASAKGTASPKADCSSMACAPGSAVEVMYEQIAEQVFSTTPR